MSSDGMNSLLEGDSNGRPRYQGWLTCTLISLLVIEPVSEGRMLGLLLLVSIGNMAVLAGLYAVSWNSRRLAAGILLALPCVILTWSFIFQRSTELSIAMNCSMVVFFVYTLTTILQRLFRSNVVGVDELFGALNVYILIGFSWGMIFHTLEVLHPGSFALGELPAVASTFTYFSFSTLGTLGIGDIRPLLPLARSLTIVEMLIGLFFVAVSFAKLVAVFRFDTEKKKPRQKDKVPFKRTSQFVSTLPAWSLVFFVAAANLATSLFNETMHMPLFLDSWATSVGVIVGGLWIGLLGGVIYNLLMAVMVWGPETWLWVINTSIVAILTAYFWKIKCVDINRPFPLIGSGLVIALASTISGLIIVNTAGLPRNPSTLVLHTIVLDHTDSVLLADFVQQFVMEAMDKVVSLAIAAIVIFAINELKLKGTADGAVHSEEASGG